MFNDCIKPHSICMRLVLSTQEEFSLKRAHYGHSPLWPSGRIILIGDVTPGQETRAGNFCFLPCLSNSMRIRGHNFLTQLFFTGSCYTKNILRHVGKHLVPHFWKANQRCFLHSLKVWYNARAILKEGCHLFDTMVSTFF